MIKGGNKVTINDVAKAAGVSKGTVDRVLHNRGEVSRKSKEKVLKVIEELGFKPNLYASLLASQPRVALQVIQKASLFATLPSFITIALVPAQTAWISFSGS